jgi:hypothetical protein
MSLINRVAIIEFNLLHRICPFVYKSDPPIKLGTSIVLNRDSYLHGDYFFTNGQVINGSDRFVWQKSLYFTDGFGKTINFRDYVSKRYRIL